MTFFESLLVLLLSAVVLLQIARRLLVPYPAMLAAAGVIVAIIPGSPTIAFAPETALALFIAPVLVDAAFDFPLGAARRFWGPLVALVVIAVLVTTAVIAWIGWAYIGLPLAAAVALGAIVSPPDAAAATTVLNAVSIPRSIEEVLKGESLFNDATALLLFSAAIAVQSSAGLTPGIILRLGFAAPGGVLLGICSALLVRRVNRFVSDTLGGNLLQFILCYLVWIVAEHLQLSAILCVIAFAMTLARNAGTTLSPRMRVHSYAVWSSVVFTLNVLAFLLMGMQARTIMARMGVDRLYQALVTAGIVIVAVVAVRMVVSVGFNRSVAWWERRKGRPEPSNVRQSVLVGWCGMRGFVTLATAFALPDTFPQRDLVVLIAFSVVLATLVVQGLTLAPVIRLLKVDNNCLKEQELTDARIRLAEAALASLPDDDSGEVAAFRGKYSVQRGAANDRSHCQSLARYRSIGLAAVNAQRRELEQLRNDNRVGIEMYLQLQEELDWSELTMLSENDRRIVES